MWSKSARALSATQDAIKTTTIPCLYGNRLPSGISGPSGLSPRWGTGEQPDPGPRYISAGGPRDDGAFRLLPMSAAPVLPPAGRRGGSSLRGRERYGEGENKKWFWLQAHRLISSSPPSFSALHSSPSCGPHADGQQIQLHRLHRLLPATVSVTSLQHRHQPADRPLQTQRLPHPRCHRLLLPRLANQHRGICLLHYVS